MHQDGSNNRFEVTLPLRGCAPQPRREPSLVSIRNILGLCILLAVLAGPAVGRECGKSEAQAAHYLASELRTWESLYDAFRKYSHCDDGAIAGGFSESVNIILAERWEMLERGAKLMERDPKFKTFVIRHLGEETPANRRARIVKSASDSCPQAQARLCGELAGKRAQ